MSARTSVRLLAILLVLPLLTGCAAGMGNYGPGADGMFRWRNAHTGYQYSGTEYNYSDHKWYTKWTPIFYPAEATKWRGAVTGGVTYGTEEMSLTGTSDRTLNDAKRIHGDVVVNLPRGVMSLGARLGYATTEFKGGGDDLKYKGFSAGPSVFLRLFPWANVDASYEHVFGSVEDVSGRYYTPHYSFLGPDVPMAGSRVQADLNVFLIRSRTADICVRAGWQQTQAGPSDVFTKQRELKSSGPFGELMLLKF